jgi:hypothetical protein
MGLGGTKMTFTEFTLPQGRIQENGGVVNVGADPAAINSSGEVAGTALDQTTLPNSVLGFTYLDGVATNFSDPAGISNGISSTTVAGINNSGEISGDYTPSGGGSEGFIYSNGIFTNFSDPGTGPDGSTYVAGINNSGLIAGSYTDSEGNSHGFTYSNGAFTNFTDPNGTYPDAFDPFLINSNTEVTGINDSGEVIGDYVDSSGAQHGFI